MPFHFTVETFTETIRAPRVASRNFGAQIKSNLFGFPLA